MTSSGPSATSLGLIDPSRPPDIQGRSKKLWLLGDGTCVVEMVPSLRSFTFDRDELVPATGALRLDFYEQAAARLAEVGVPTVFRRRLGATTYLAAHVPAPPFEVIVKNRAVGSTTRKYPGLFEEGARLPRPVVKFDYRTDPEDQPIGEDYLRVLGVDVDGCRQLALACNAHLSQWLEPNDLYDFCLVIGSSPDGRLVINSEISPDCMRLRGPDGEPRDKDLFRSGASPDRIIAVWSELVASLGASRER
jgi:phosphoribosylaminoimidazole-succinocarboxamide synthase